MAFANEALDALVNAATRFSAAIEQQLETVQSHPLPAELVEKTIDYAKAKTAYITALREAMPELINIATGKEFRPGQLDKFTEAFESAGEKQEKAADEKTRVLLDQISGNPGVEKARAEFESAQKIEETFHEDFYGVGLS